MLNTKDKETTVWLQAELGFPYFLPESVRSNWHLKLETVMWFRCLSLLSAILFGLPSSGSAESTLQASALVENTWRKVTASKTGGRSSPILFYEPKQKLFYLTGGRPGGTYPDSNQHYSTEVFDLNKMQWVNAYPAGSPYTTLTGVTDAPPPQREKGQILGRDENGLPTISVFNEYKFDSRAHHQWAFIPDRQKLFASILNTTISYDVNKRSWTDLKTSPFSKGNLPMVWGNFAYDPINKEVLSIGGSSNEPGGTPGSWVYELSGNKWTKLSFSNDAAALQNSNRLLYDESRVCLAAYKNRFYATESETEQQVDLVAKCRKTVTGIENLVKDIQGSAIKSLGATALQEAVRRLEVAKRLFEKQIQSKSTIDFTELKNATDWIWQAERALDIQPFGRAHAQMAYDSKNNKIVLFGGNALDSCLADTWVYDVTTKKWTQRFPQISPSPRAGHSLTFLPKSQKMALLGGYTMDGFFRHIGQVETWTYDVNSDEWNLLSAVDLPKNDGQETVPLGEPLGEPWAGGGSPWLMASTDDDMLLAISTGNHSRSTWLFKANPNKTALAQTKNLGVETGALAFSYPPEEYETAAGTPNDAFLGNFLKGLKLNQWVALPESKKRPAAYRAWNTTTYDPDRHQLLLWGGGHVTYMGTEVSHLSMKTNLWSSSSNPDLPTAPTGGFPVRAHISFKDRPRVPIHAYQAYAYDPPSGKMIYLDRAYNVVERRWEPQPIPGLKHKEAMKTLLETTPNGAIALSGHGLYQHQENTWRKLRWNGVSFGSAWADGHALVFDPKRKAIWMANNQIFRYDTKTGNVVKYQVKIPKVLGEYALWREQVYVPELDMILLMRLFKAPDGKLKNIGWDPETTKYYWLDLPFIKNGKSVTFSKPPFEWSDAISYDPDFKIVILHQQSKTPWISRFDKNSVVLTEIIE